MYTRHQEERFGAFPIPEIKRIPLESVSLTVKILHNDVKVRREYADIGVMN